MRGPAECSPESQRRPLGSPRGGSRRSREIPPLEETHASTLTSATALALFLAACSTAASPIAGTPTAGTPAAGIPAAGTPAGTQPGGRPPTPQRDPDLSARFPTTIAGAEVTVQTLRASDFLQFFEEESEELAEAEAFLTAIGVGMEAISIGLGSFEYQDSSEQLSAMRAQGADPARLLTSLVAFTQADADDPAGATIAQAIVGGRPVTTLTRTDDTTVTYIYRTGETIWFFETEDAALADQVMGAIP